eukprot:TRINITY_DN49582_c0_g1_i2.p1 TRINITY_DN49582_c0_g1~~TRINITY_DN49582_c0_g1_i2.p1  ORF type:complete len:212 (+),score=32.27 TRINITY_DN49582_c0_g1_i2:242-877(+)
MNLGLSFCETPDQPAPSLPEPAGTAPEASRSPTSSVNVQGIELAVDENAKAQLVGEAAEESMAEEIGFRVTCNGRIRYVKLSQLDTVDRECLEDLYSSYMGGPHEELWQRNDRELRSELRALVAGEEEVAFRETASRHEAMEHKVVQLLETGAAGMSTVKRELVRIEQEHAVSDRIAEWWRGTSISASRGLADGWGALSGFAQRGRDVVFY